MYSSHFHFHSHSHFYAEVHTAAWIAFTFHFHFLSEVNTTTKIAFTHTELKFYEGGDNDDTDHHHDGQIMIDS